MPWGVWLTRDWLSWELTDSTRKEREMTMEGDWITFCLFSDEAFDSIVTIVQWFYVLNQ